MSEPDSAENQTDNQQTKKKNKIVTAFFNLIREGLAIFIWGYAITKLFIFDIDNFLVERFMPNYAWLLTYKFFILIVVTSIIWLITKNSQIILWSLFVFFYPLIILLWRIPGLILKKKSWNMAFAFTDAIISFFKSIKNAFITTSFFLACTVIILQFSNQVLLWCSIIILMVILLLVYIQRTFLVFRSSGIYQVYSQFFYGLGKYARGYMFQLDDDEVNLPFESMKDKQIEKWVNHVEQLVLVNKMCLFVAKKLKTYQESGFNIVAYVFGILLLALFTVFSFAVINYGLFKINEQWYSFTATPSFFNFFYYSFNLLLFNSVQEVVAIAPASQIAFMTETFFVLFLIAILVSLVFTFRSQKDAEELKDAINDLSNEGTRIEGYIKDRYKMGSIDLVMSLLEGFNASFMRYINAIIKEMM